MEQQVEHVIVGEWYFVAGYSRWCGPYIEIGKIKGLKYLNNNRVAVMIKIHRDIYGNWVKPWITTLRPTKSDLKHRFIHLDDNKLPEGVK